MHSSNSVGDNEIGAEAGRAPELQPVGPAFFVAYSAVNFGLSLTLLTPTLFSIAYKVQTIDEAGKDSHLGITIGIGGLVMLLAGPLLGVLSDRTRSRWGRRRPYLVAGVAVALLGAFILGSATTVFAVVLGWSISGIGIAALSTAVLPVMAEAVPESQRGRVAALSGVAAQFAGVVATLAGSLLTGSHLVLFTAPVLVLLVCAVGYLLAVPEQQVSVPERTGRLLQAFADLRFDPRRERDFSLVIIGKFLVQIAMNFFATYQLYFVIDRLGFTPESAGQQLALVGGLGLVVAAVLAVVSGSLSDRLGRRKPFVYVSSAAIALGLLLVAVAPNLAVYVTGALVLVAGAGALATVDLALVGDVMPNRSTEAGKYMSIYNMSGGLAGVVAPVLAPVILSLGSGGNYTVLFCFAAAVAVGHALVVRPIRQVR